MSNYGNYKLKDEKLFEAVAELKAGKATNTNLVYELSEKYIYKIINDIVKDHYATEDLMQETYIQIYNKIDTLQDEKAFYVWAGRIATNFTLRYIQKNRHEVLAAADENGDTDFVFEQASDDTEEFIPEAVLENKEKQRLIAEILDNLSVEQKLCVQYFYYEEMPVKEIARLMEVSEGTIKSRLNYARKSIKDAVIDLDVNKNTRLYSLAALPLFWIIFREGLESFIIAGASAGAASAVGGGVSEATSSLAASAVGGGRTGGQRTTSTTRATSTANTARTVSTASTASTASTTGAASTIGTASQTFSSATGASAGQNIASESIVSKLQSILKPFIEAIIKLWGTSFGKVIIVAVVAIIILIPTVIRKNNAIAPPIDIEAPMPDDEEFADDVDDELYGLCSEICGLLYEWEYNSSMPFSVRKEYASKYEAVLNDYNAESDSTMRYDNAYVMINLLLGNDKKAREYGAKIEPADSTSEVVLNDYGKTISSKLINGDMEHVYTFDEYGRQTSHTINSQGVIIEKYVYTYGADGRLEYEDHYQYRHWSEKSEAHETYAVSFTNSEMTLTLVEADNDKPHPEKRTFPVKDYEIVNQQVDEYLNSYH